MCYYETTMNDTLQRLIHQYVDDNYLREACLYAVMNGGKRIRPQLSIAFAQFFGEKTDNIYQIAAAIEYIHCYSLVHDDLPAMDNDDMRRGLPTAHKKFDEATAILIGDSLLTLAFEVITNLNISSDIRCNLMSTLSKAAGASGMIKGQAQDMHLSLDYIPNNIEHIKAMTYNKTGALLSASCKMGAIAAGISDQKILNDIEQYAYHIGSAFQLKDDILDYESTFEEVGKKTKKDAKDGKINLVTLLGIEKTKQELNNHIDNALKSLNSFSQGKDDDTIRKLTFLIANRNN